MKKKKKNSYLKLKKKNINEIKEASYCEINNKEQKKKKKKKKLKKK